VKPGDVITLESPLVGAMTARRPAPDVLTPR
jgi:hypothetical protein